MKISATSYSDSLVDRLLIGVLCMFAFFRPIVIMHGTRLHAGVFNILELFSITISYLLILALFLNIHRIRLDFLAIAIVFFAAYILLSIAWGSNYKYVARVILPLVVFFSAAIPVDDSKVERLLLFLIWGYAVFICVNFTLIGLDKSGLIVYEFRRGITRYAGAADRIHPLAHSMFLYSMAYFWYLRKGLGANQRLTRIILLLLLFASFYCIYETRTRNVYIGLVIFWGVYFWGTSKRKFFLFAFSVLTAFFLLFSDLRATFSDVINPIEGKARVETMGSGRIGIWKDTLKLYSRLSPSKKLLGTGIGGLVSENGWKRQLIISSPHNDYLGLLVTTGLIGLLIHIIIFGKIFWDVYRFKSDRPLRWAYLALILAVVAMNFLSNSYLSRVELSQMFWFFVGLFYVEARHRMSDDHPVTSYSANGALPRAHLEGYSRWHST